MHYKIKDDVDLNVLEEYGYERVGITDNYAKFIPAKSKNNYSVSVCVLNNRKIMWYCFTYRITLLEEKNKHYIKDLIDAGLVEEVNDD